MLVKIKAGDKTLQFNSADHVIAVLLDDQSKKVCDNLKPNERLLLSGPIKAFAGGSGEALIWAMEGWGQMAAIPHNALVLPPGVKP